VTTSPGAGLRLRRLELAAAERDEALAAELAALLRRGAVPDLAVREAVREILAGVRADPDAGLRAASARHGGGLPDGRLLLDAGDLRGARDALRPELRIALEQAIGNVRRFAESQVPVTSVTTIGPGIEIERRWLPLERVGAYVPGGTAPYPSSLIMGVVPARVAGVDHVTVASPAGADGTVDPVLLGAAGLLEVDAFLVAGGAQAIAALAFGLPGAGLRPVDRIVGPGNAWVTAAKVELVAEVGIDLPAGPSEGMVLADGAADPTFVAADLITQAEHGVDSPAILVTADRALADAVDVEIGRQLPDARRRAILEQALSRHGRVVLAPNLDAAIDFVNAYAPEHLSVDVRSLDATVSRIRNAGSIFVGPWAPESAGDYATGANHVLPTGGLARSYGPLSVESFGKYSQVQRISREGLAGLRSTVTALASAEGLEAHRAAVEMRFRQGSEW
jgi:histidinol dehydrogenase